MGETTSIAWTHHTWSPWWGCTKVSAGCANCYADAFDRRWGVSHWGPGAPRRVMSAQHWRQPLRWDRAAAKAGERRRVFPSMCDPFDPEAPAGEFERLIQLIAETPHLDWLLLTKRPAEMLDRWPWPVIPPHNVWAGVSAEDGARWRERVPTLRRVNSWVRFVSAEPLIDGLALMPNDLALIDWLILGGESGPKRREMEPHWIADAVDAARQHGTRVFVKQDSGPHPGSWGRISEDLRIREVPTR